MRKVWLAIVLGGSALAHVAAGGADVKPFQVVHESEVEMTGQSIMYREGQTVIVRSDDAKNSHFKDLYVVKTPEWFAVPESIMETGDLVEFVPAKFAVMRISDGEVHKASALLHESGLACGGLFKLKGDVVKEERILAPEPVIPIELRQDTVVQLVDQVVADNIRNNVIALTEFTTRYHSTDTGRSVPEFLQEKYQEMVGDREDITVSLYDHGSETSQKSIVIRIEGQTRPDEVMVLGSHIDSVNWRDGSRSRAPGADDNASGTATNMEIFRLIIENNIQLHRTLEIHGYAAEEIGLVGSQDIAADYRRDGVNVIAMVQHDMNLWKAPGAEDKIWLVTSNTQNDFNDQLAQLVNGYVGLPVEKASLSGGSSDHASWNRQGYPAAFPFENPRSYNRHIHTRDDTIANSGAFDQAAGFAKLGLAYIAHFAGMM